ncbi:hypothetical protein [Marinobacter zhejiangensis]|uniref:Uncharacterized protein n=1 Tax=Marinobacter zhejiangensis TaxID=488535 RepID=A0A1I4MET7_9GAMM|nr:hypothetical protein [Marinobacter zhejiangensis]SFM01573.1 hypothetical protein SAMN04487963_1024 [Marinobacter zhejiangensis]
MRHFPRFQRHLQFALLLAGLSVSMSSQAENIDLLMSEVFATDEATYIGFQSVERTDIPVTAAVDRKYLIVDFRIGPATGQEQLQASVHKACMTLLHDRELIRSLSDAGYDMVSVAFDRQSQYDCL